MSSIANLNYGQAAHSVVRLGLSDALLSSISSIALAVTIVLAVVVVLAVIIAMSLGIFVLKTFESIRTNLVNPDNHSGTH